MSKLEASINNITEIILLAAQDDPSIIKGVVDSISNLEVGKKANKVSNRVEWISKTETIAELRRRIKCASAKKSKSKNSPVSFNKHDQELKAGYKRLNDLLKEANTLSRLIDLREEPKRLLSTFLSMKESDLDLQFKYLGIPKKQEIQLVKGLDPSCPDDLRWQIESIMGIEICNIYLLRTKRRESRVVRINRRFRLVEKIIKGILCDKGALNNETNKP